MSLLDKFKSVLEYITLMGFDWFIFRVKYELLKKFNYFDNVNKSILQKVDSCDKELFTYQRVGLLKSNFQGDNSFIKKADEAINGNIFSFSNEYLDYFVDGKINWQMNPVSKVKAAGDLSWNNLSDFGEYGDIKLIWEASRFPQVYFFINAYAVTHNEKYAHACISQIIDWCESNPYPQGLNYKCGQEITFRIFSWINALEYFHDFISSEEEYKIVENIYTSLLRIDANIDYAAKSVKNNHSISEAAGLFIIGLLFPQFKESKKIVTKGLKYLLQESSYQVYKDGSYIQHSFTYQRLALDILSFVILVADKKSFELPKDIIERHYSMVEFLNSFIQEDGWLPNYGSNDGANLFPIDSSNYRDFRTSLNFAMGESDFFNIESKVKTNLTKKIEFSSGGYYILKSDEIFTFIRSHSYYDRPAQNDMFHLDIWYQGKNIFCDAGSYSYNTDKVFKDNFIGTKGHNTVLVNHTNQMKQVLNFGWTNWTETDLIEFDANLFHAKNMAYKKDFNTVHCREVAIEDKKLVIKDFIEGDVSKSCIQQIWNTKYEVEIIDEYSLKVDNCIISSNKKYLLEESYMSDYYNSYSKGTRVIFEFDSDIVTMMEFVS